MTTLQDEFECKEQRLEGSESPQKMTADNMISNLGRVAEDIRSRFSCGGKLELSDSSLVKVAYKTTTAVTTLYINCRQR